MPPLDASVSRPMWEAVERLHGLTYVAPEVRDEATAAGLKGFWMNYFATRAAPLGAASASLVESTFFYYGPHRVHRAIPDAWAFSTPGDVLAARYRGMDLALRRVYGRAVESQDMAEAAALVHKANAGCHSIGRVLYAGWAAQAWPDEPHLALWHGCTLLREYRSGNHLMAVCHEGLDGCESVVSHVAVGGAPRAWIRDEAAWSEVDENAAIERLQERGWLDLAGAATPECHAGRARIEALTDQLDFPVWDRLGESDGQRLFDLLSEFATLLPPDDQLDWQHHYPDQ